MHIICNIIKLTNEEDNNSLADEEEDFEGTDMSNVNASSLAHQPSQDQSMLSLSTIKSSGTNRREKSKHSRNASRDAP